MQTYLLCASIGLNAFCAGGMFTFPLLSPAMAEYHKFSQPQLTTIILTGMISQYPLSLPVGSIVDKRGPALCSLVAGLLFAIGFGVIASQTANVPAGLEHASPASFYWLIFSYLLIGTGTIFSYGSSLFTSSKAFPNHIGLSSAATMVSFGLSPLFFSQVATSFFMDSVTGFLRVAAFTTFVSLLTLFVHTFGFLNYRRLSINASGMIEAAPAQRSEEHGITDESTPLIASDAPVHINTHPSPPNIRALLKQADIWIFALFCVLIIGGCEMVISNIGTIAESLPASYDSPTSTQKRAGSSAALQVKVISVTNTAFRLIIGPLADYSSPISVFLPTGVRTFTRKHVISRFAFLTGAAALISVTFFWMSVGINTQAELWALSAGTGLSYSTVFTILPSLLSSMWGLQNLGRNFGLMMFAPFTGTPLFSYLYALISAANTQPGSSTCKGRVCWELTFSIATFTSLIALLLSLVLWRRWHGTI